MDHAVRILHADKSWLATRRIFFAVGRPLLVASGRMPYPNFQAKVGRQHRHKKAWLLNHADQVAAAHDSPDQVVTLLPS